MIFDVKIEKNEGKEVKLKFVLANGEPANLKAVTFFAALEKYIDDFEIDYFSLVRNNLYDINMQKIVIDK